jgi:excisionase family DNA binding protein
VATLSRRVDVATAAACARVSVRTLQRWIEQGRLTVTGTPRRRRVSQGEVEQLLVLLRGAA